MMRRRIAFAIAVASLLAVGQCRGSDIQSPGQIGKLIGLLGSLETRGRAANSLAEIGPDVIPELSKVLSGKGDLDLKQGVVFALSQIGSPEAEATLRAALTASDARVRFEAAGGLYGIQRLKGTFSKAELWEPTKSGLLDEDSNVRNVAVERLAMIDRAAAVPLIVETLDRELRKPRGERGTYRRPETLRFYGEDATVVACMNWLVMAPKTSVPLIETYVPRTGNDLGYCLASILATFGCGPVHSELLIEGATKCSSVTGRIRIIGALWRLSDPRVNLILREAQHDGYAVVVPETQETIYPVRRAAERSIRRLELKAEGKDPLSVDAPAAAISANGE